MRDRVEADWLHDLSARHALEERVARTLGEHPSINLDEVATDSFVDLDYRTSIDGTPVPIELKSKWQRYVGWDRHAPAIPEADLLILDELALRKLIDAGRHAHLLVMDKPGKRWVVFGVPELLLADKVRVTRVIRRQTTRQKAKVLVDLTYGLRADRLGKALDLVVDRLASFDQRWNAIEPWPLPNHTEVS